jgi:hypothetical protein
MQSMIRSLLIPVLLATTCASSAIAADDALVGTLDIQQLDELITRSLERDPAVAKLMNEREDLSTQREALSEAGKTDPAKKAEGEKVWRQIRGMDAELAVRKKAILDQALEKVRPARMSVVLATEYGEPAPIVNKAPGVLVVDITEDVAKALVLGK